MSSVLIVMPRCWAWSRGALEHAAEEFVFLALDFVDLAERGGVGGHSAFDREGGDVGADGAGEREGAVKRLV
jgi:hypothetical protein